MRIGKKPGIERRPLEYVLVGIGLILVAILLAINFAIGRYENQGTVINTEENESLQGTLFEVGDLADKDEGAERALDNKYDDQELGSASADSAADDIGGVYDETSY